MKHDTITFWSRAYIGEDHAHFRVVFTKQRVAELLCAIQTVGRASREMLRYHGGGPLRSVVFGSAEGVDASAEAGLDEEKMAPEQCDTVGDRLLDGEWVCDADTEIAVFWPDPNVGTPTPAELQATDPVLVITPDDGLWWESWIGDHHVSTPKMTSDILEGLLLDRLASPTQVV